MLSRFPKISVLTLLKLGFWKFMNKLTKNYRMTKNWRISTHTQLFLKKLCGFLETLQLGCWLRIRFFLNW